MDARSRTKFRIKRRISESTGAGQLRPRLTVFRSQRHIYAQVILDQESKTLAAASSLDKDVQAEIQNVRQLIEAGSIELDGSSKKGAQVKGEGQGSAAGNAAKSTSSKSVIAACAVGYVLGKRLKSSNFDKVVFDRNGRIFHGRVKAVAQGARAAGVEF